MGYWLVVPHGSNDQLGHQLLLMFKILEFQISIVGHMY